ncbi:glycosyltransferase [Bacillus sp. RO2]|nr:glycosyltransferase [Bacillus sp. RO2]
MLNQSYETWEIFLVDEQSSDNSVFIIKQYAENNARINFFN